VASAGKGQHARARYGAVVDGPLPTPAETMLEPAQPGESKEGKAH